MLSFSRIILVLIGLPVIDGLMFGNFSHPGVHKGSILSNHRAGPNSTPAQRSLNRKPAPDANPGVRWAFQMQRSTLTRTRLRSPRRPLAQWSFFCAWGLGEGQVLQVGVLVRAWAKLAIVQLFSTKDTLGRGQRRSMSDNCLLPWKLPPKIPCTSFFLSTDVLHLQICNHTNLPPQIKTHQTGRDRAKHLKINLKIRQELNAGSKLRATSVRVICRTAAGKHTNMPSPSEPGGTLNV